MSGPIAEILSVGTEILLGEIVDTNARHIGRRLREMGIDVYRTATVGDNRRRIAAAIETSASRSDLCLVTGGLGPTADDVTREAAADAAGVELAFRPDQWDAILARFQAFGRKPKDNNRRQAFLPATAEAVQNPVGTAPGFCLTVSRGTGGGDAVSRGDSGDRREEGSRLDSGGPPSGGCLVVCLPGVPREMEAMLEQTVLPAVAGRFPGARPIQVRLVRTIGMPESEIDAQLDDLMSGANPTVGLAARAGMVDVRIAAKAESEAAAKDLIAPIEDEVRRRLGDAVFGVDSDRPGPVARRRLASRGWRLAAAEIGLRGALTRVLTEGSEATNAITCVEVYGRAPEDIQLASPAADIEAPSSEAQSNSPADTAETPSHQLSADVLAERHGADVALVAETLTRAQSPRSRPEGKSDVTHADPDSTTGPGESPAGEDSPRLGPVQAETSGDVGRVRLVGPGFELEETFPLGPNPDYGRDRLANIALGLLLRQLVP